jgi:surfeit locus 1 family protein
MQASLAMQRGIPLGKPPVVELRNQHAQYAATWYVVCSHDIISLAQLTPRFSLSAATSVMLVLLLRRGKIAPKGKQWHG